jgi:DNA invertase Pin-like site-specific DNA recombinase
VRIALYTRVSTANQKPELRLEELRAYAERQQWEVAETYQDIISGAKAKCLENSTSSWMTPG